VVPIANLTSPEKTEVQSREDDAGTKPEVQPNLEEALDMKFGATR
jgi:hypothetical protein